MFYLKLAWGNLKKSLPAYAPFVLCLMVLYVLTGAVLFILNSPIATSRQTGVMTLNLALIVLIIFSVIMATYSYSFLLKQRSREFGLYNILGMNKGQVALISSLELGLVYLFTLLCGTGLSAVFSKFLYLIFVNLIHVNDLTMALSLKAILTNMGIFTGIFVLLSLIGLGKIYRQSSLSLFQSAKQGEREPRGNVILAGLSLICLGLGYYMSISSNWNKTTELLTHFFQAVILVIAGTYLFYISFMAWYLKQRRKNKNYFYQPEHFVSISQMIFRMKHNAVGLASISILAIMAIVTVATTTSLYVSINSLAEKIYPTNSYISVFAPTHREAKELLDNKIAPQMGLSADNFKTYSYNLMSLAMTNQKNVVITGREKKTLGVSLVYLVTREDFLIFNEATPALSQGQVAYYQEGTDNDIETIKLFGTTYDNVGGEGEAYLPVRATTYNSAVLVVPDVATYEAIFEDYAAVVTEYGGYAASMTTDAYANLTEEQINALDTDEANFLLEDGPEQSMLGIVYTKASYISKGYEMYGGVLFTGFLLASAFILGAALVIYYKQYSEGQEDKASYSILQAVGMSKAQVKKTINSQTVFVFFMPLATAVLHFAAALTMLVQILKLFVVADMSLILIVSGGTIVIISLVYYLIYRLTSRSYYRIVER